MSENTVLITGGAGFIGSHLALKLISKGYIVTILDNLSPQVHGQHPDKESPLYLSIRDKVRFIRGTVTSKDDLREAIEGQGIIVHLAAETGTGQSMYEVEHYTDVNIGGTVKLLDLLAKEKHQVRRFVVASSRAVYGEGRYRSVEKDYVYPLQRTEACMSKGDFEVKVEGCQQPLMLVGTDEESKIHPTSVYGITKQVQEEMVMTVCPVLDIAPVAFRFQNVYGPGQSLSNPYTGILSIFSTRIVNGNNVIIFEDGRESRDFVFIEDVVDATILGIESDRANNEVFNVGEGVPTDVLTVGKTLIKKFEGSVKIIVSGSYRLGDIRHNYADLTKIKSKLNFSPKWTFDRGISEFVAWVKNQRIPSDKYEESISEMVCRGIYK
ncbi:MAG: NAD-dependent epimerase/dehydratase family protein [Terracidiphilus sp.]|nr:NAD-dependent epimerase/dehydratase family protein [Terracidiphilus sp.]